jgi:hypothetical protein
MADLQVRQIRSAATSHQQEVAIVAPARSEIKARSMRPRRTTATLRSGAGRSRLSWFALVFGLS